MTGPETGRTPPSIVTLVALAGLSALSMNVFLPSLPGMARWFQVDYGVMQLSVSVYLAVTAILQLFVGPISDMFGRRPVMLGALVIFLLATIGTLLAPTAEWFLVFRMMQAVIAAGMVLSRAVVRDIVPGDAAASLLGYVTMGMSIVPMLAPIFGGMLDEAFGWKANFAMMGLLGLAVLILCWFDMGETSRPGGVPLRAQFAQYPVLARSWRFWGYSIVAMLASGSFFAYLGGAPYIGETVFHLTSSQVGYWFAAPAVGYALGNYISGRYAVRIGMNRLILLGTLASVLPLAVVLLADILGWHQPLVFFGGVTMVGLGNGLVLPSANAGMMSVRPELAGTASGFGGAMMVAGGAVMATLAGALLSPTSGAAPLLWIMLLSAVGALVTIRLVIKRQKRLDQTG
ncbi:multidrug effflux MFS transporter [Paracoccus sp. DMF-8]|uniref:multidrug effflux MFS transporter n=1 Tax=Paracoccus sp. DMF-8 TaxID=3019445 RepID=UPI0023E86F6A|nr:multidrug effflux MFS transporter [Paracoccus sp. DMF-8]MDF3605588.1 multidrug effflux MFS transporter [Paracoccus sp. DMF-8]